VVSNEGVETHDILRRFLKPWYLTKVPKTFPKVQKNLGNTFPTDDLAGETTTL